MDDSIVSDQDFEDGDRVLSGPSLDYNRYFDDGPTFRDVTSIHGPWDRYIQRSMQNGEDSDDASEEDEGLNNAEGPKPKKENNNLSAEAALELVVRDDGRIWIPDLLGRNRLDLQALVRAYLTAHYSSYIVVRHYCGTDDVDSGKACNNQKVSAPFKQLGKFQDRLFAQEHLPEDFTFHGDPSHMKMSDATLFLQFIRTRQQTSPNDVFGFRYIVNRDGDLVDVIPNADDSDVAPVVPRGKQRSKSKDPRTIAATQPSQHVRASKTQNAGQSNSDRDLPQRPRQSSQAGEMPNDHVPNMDDELPRHTQQDRMDPSTDSRPSKGKGKQVHRPKDVVEVGLALGPSKHQPPPPTTSATSQKVGPPIGGRHIRISVRNIKNMMYIVKRSKDVGEARRLPKATSGLKGPLGNAGVSSRCLEECSNADPLSHRMFPLPSVLIVNDPALLNRH